MSTAASKTIVVTGASRGIGAAVCQRLLAAGHTVIGLARQFRDPALDPVDQHLIDLEDLAGLPQRLTELVRSYPRVDAVIANAGRGKFGSLEEFSYPQIGSVMDLNFTAQAYVSKAFLPGMKRRGAGDLIFVGSEAALSGGRRGAVYAASKAALRGFALALRDECARSGVRVGVINPGSVRTEFFDDLSFSPGDDPTNALLPEEVADAVVQMLTLRGAAVIDEINLSPLKKVLKFK